MPDALVFRLFPSEPVTEDAFTQLLAGRQSECFMLAGRLW